MLSSIFKTCVPRDEVISGSLSEDVFAAKLKQVVEGNAPEVYQDPNDFFANTFPTNGLKTLISEVFGRLTGMDSGSPVIRLETSFGGGKTHDEIALWHIAKNGRSIHGLERFVGDLSIIPDRPIQVAAIACQDLDPINGVLHEELGIKVHKQFFRLDYQGGLRGFQCFLSPATALLNTEGVRVNVSLKLIFTFEPAIAHDSNELANLQQALSRNPVDRLSLTAKVSY